MNPEDKPIANPMIVFREEFDDWAVLFNPETGDTFWTESDQCLYLETFERQKFDR